jgi:hypothetical protein
VERVPQSARLVGALVGPNTLVMHFPGMPPIGFCQKQQSKLLQTVAVVTPAHPTAGVRAQSVGALVGARVVGSGVGAKVGGVGERVGTRVGLVAQSGSGLQHCLENAPVTPTLQPNSVTAGGGLVKTFNSHKSVDPAPAPSQLHLHPCQLVHEEARTWEPQVLSGRAQTTCFIFQVFGANYSLVNASNLENFKEFKKAYLWVVNSENAGNTYDNEDQNSLHFSDFLWSMLVHQAQKSLFF